MIENTRFARLSALWSQRRSVVSAHATHTSLIFTNIIHQMEGLSLFVVMLTQIGTLVYYQAGQRLSSGDGNTDENVMKFMESAVTFFLCCINGAIFVTLVASITVQKFRRIQSKCRKDVKSKVSVAPNALLESLAAAGGGGGATKSN